MRLKIDGVEVTIVGNHRTNDGSGVTLLIRPLEADRGVHSRHDVPLTNGKFRTNGHNYEFF